VIPIYKPFLPEEVKVYALDAIKSGWISSRGEYVERTTEALKGIFGYKHVLLTSSGTAAGHLTTIALRRFRPDIGRIVVPNNVYVAAWNTLLQEYSLDTLWAVDADIDTWCAGTKGYQLAIQDPWRVAALVVHNLGGVVNVARMMNECPALSVIEDNCEGIFGAYNGHPTGTLSLASSISFFGNKTLTAGEGGAFVTGDANVYEYIARVGNQGATDKRYRHDVLGYNYRMTNVQAALLYGQLLHVDEIRARKQFVFESYRAGLPLDRVVLQKSEDGTVAADWMMGVRVVGSRGYEDVERFMAERGVLVRPMFYPVHAHEHLREMTCAGAKIARLLHRECFMIPSYPEMTASEVSQVIAAVHAYARSF